MKVTIVVGLLALAACTGTPAASTIISTTATAPSSTTTQPEPCPDEVCVRIRLDPMAVWSDGIPVTARDFVHTWERTDDDRISGVEFVGDHEIVLALPRRVPIERLFEVVLPAHDETATSGGFRWDGSRLEGAGDAISIVVADGVRGVVQSLRREEADVAWLADPPAWAVDELGALDGVSVAIEPGPDWEMVTFNQVNSLLAETWARTAIATAIDREAILDATVRAVDPDAVILDSTMWQEDGGPYPHRHDQAAARRILEDNGCALGSDGFYECGGRRMSFVWATTAGDPWRETALQLASDQLGQVGIEVVPSLLIPSDLYTTDHLFGEEWDIVSFAWTSEPDPSASEPLFRCGGELNIGGHCDEAIDDLLDRMMASQDAGERLRLLGEVDSKVISAAAVVPLYRRPIVGAGLERFAPPPVAGPFEGVADWEGEVRLALPAPPGDPAVVGALDPVTGSLRRILYRGAFRALPDGRYAPGLVVGFEILGD